jgi:hypothetical protein
MVAVDPVLVVGTFSPYLSVGPPHTSALFCPPKVNIKTDSRVVSSPFLYP